VVKPGDEHWVTTADRKVHRAKIRGADPRSGLAVLEVEADDLVPMRFADVSNLRKGHLVIALGNPYAIARDGQVSASWGIISNLARKAGPLPGDDPSDRRATLHHFGTLIQTDAKLNLGTSGGALINLRGEMVGLTTALAAGAGYEMAAGYAVPMDEAIRRVIGVLKEGREVEYGLLGVVTENLLADELRRGVRGMRVRQIVEGTPADHAGLKPGDIISHVNRQAIYDADGLVLEVGKQAAEARIQLTVLGRRQPVDVKLAKLRVRGEKIITNRPPDWRGVRVDHATAVEGFQTLARMGLVDLKGCVAVINVERDSLAWQAGLRPKMFISHVGSRRVSRPQEFREAVAALDGPVRIRLTLPENQDPVRTIPAGQ
jgi:serine protease Do